jgi:hypothetical protein
MAPCFEAATRRYSLRPTPIYSSYRLHTTASFSCRLVLSVAMQPLSGKDLRICGRDGYLSPHFRFDRLTGEVQTLTKDGTWVRETLKSPAQ